MRDLSKLAIIFVGLTTLAELPRGLWDVASAISTLDSGDGLTGAAWLIVLSVLLTAAMGLGLILGANRLAARFFRDEAAVIDVSPVELLRLTLLIFGVVTFAYGLVGLAFFGAEVIQSASSGQSPLIEFQPVSQMIVPVMRLAIGLVLVLSSRSLSRSLWAIGSAKTPQPQTHEAG